MNLKRYNTEVSGAVISRASECDLGTSGDQEIFQTTQASTIVGSIDEVILNQRPANSYFKAINTSERFQHDLSERNVLIESENQ